MAIGTSDGEHFPSQLEEVLSKLDPPNPMSKAPRNLNTDIRRDLNEDDVFPNGVPVLPNRNNEGVIDQSPSSLNDPNKWFLRVENDQLPENAKPTLYEGMTNLEHIPEGAIEEALKAKANADKEGPSSYSKLVDWLENNFQTPMQGIEKWSTREKIGYILATSMNALGPGRGPGFRVTGKSGLANPNVRALPANDNMTGAQQVQRIENNIETNLTRKSLAEIEAEAAKAVEPKTAFERALERQKAGRPTPTGDSADELIQSLRSGKKPDLKLVDQNPSQEPQGRPIPGEQARTQEAQRAANDRNYQLGKGTDRVNVGPGKGVLNDNKEEVSALIRKGSTPSEIARKFDITPMAVRNWIKRNGPITSIDDIPKK